jgi:DNA-binding NarL/FixJ family response regulator
MDDPGTPKSAGGAGVVLILEDDAEFARRVIGRHYTRHFTVRYVYNIPQARAALSALDTLTLAIVDLEVPGGRPFDSSRGGGGFEIVELVRDQFPRARVLVLTEHLHPKLVNTAHRLGATYVCKSECSDNLRAAARAALATHHGIYDRPAAFVARFADGHQLTPRQTEILVLVIAGRTHAEIAAELGITSNTLKRHIRHILAACGERQIDAIARKFWRHASEPEE